MKVEVLRFTPLNGDSSLKGFAEVRVADKVIFRDVRLVQSPGKDAFVSPPQREYINKEGEKKYTKLVEWPRDWDDAIKDAVYNAWVEGASPQYVDPSPRRDEYTPQGGVRQDHYHSDAVQQPRQPQRPTQAQGRRAYPAAPSPQESYDDIQDPFAE